MNRWVINSVVLLVAFLAGATAYYGSKSIALERVLNDRHQTTAASSEPTIAPSDLTTSPPTASPTPNSTITSSASPSATPSTANVSSSSVSVAPNDRLAQPAQTYTVVQGDTLSPIGQKNNLPWETIAAANALVEPYKLKIGQILVLPTLVGSTKQVTIDFSVDPGRLATTQTSVDKGSNLWRLDPGQTAQNEATGFGLQVSDQYKLVTKDDKAGTAQVSVVHSSNGHDQTYTMSLTQPGTKGSKGVWALQKIAVATS